VRMPVCEGEGREGVENGYGEKAVSHLPYRLTNKLKKRKGT
jgi:hypothetical protein